MSKHEPVNPASRDDNDEEQVVDATHGIARDGDETSLQKRQAEQNQDANKEYDPTNGRRPDQRRRNDKQGQMGG